MKVCHCKHDREEHDLGGECVLCPCEMFDWAEPDAKVIAELRAADERLWRELGIGVKDAS